MATDSKETKKRELTNLTTDVFKDQIKDLEKITAATGDKRAALVRQGIDMLIKKHKVK